MTRSGSSLSDMHLGRLLQERGYINEHQLVDALRAQAASGGRLGTILIKRGCLSDAQLYAALRTQDDLRRAGVVFDLALVAGNPAHGADLALAVTVPHAGSQGGLPHHGIVAHQHVLVPGSWLPGMVSAENISGPDCFVLKAADGRMLDYVVGIELGTNDDALALGHNTPAPVQAGEPREDGFEELSLRVTVSADSLRDGGAGRFSGRLGLRFGSAA
jgi:hypothetical protein